MNLTSLKNRSVISDDGIKDHDSVQIVQVIIDNYLRHEVLIRFSKCMKLQMAALPSISQDTASETCDILQTWHL